MVLRDSSVFNITPEYVEHVRHLAGACGNQATSREARVQSGQGLGHGVTGDRGSHQIPYLGRPALSSLTCTLGLSLVLQGVGWGGCCEAPVRPERDCAGTRLTQKVTAGFYLALHCFSSASLQSLGVGQTAFDIDLSTSLLLALNLEPNSGAASVPSHPIPRGDPWKFLSSSPTPA